MRDKYRLLTPGPTPMPEEARLAMARDMVHHRKTPFKKLLRDIQGNLQLLFATRQPVLPLTCSGTGAMVAAVTNCFTPGEKVLVVEAGKFGERWSEIAENHGLRTTCIRKEWGRSVTPQEVAQALDSEPDITGVLVQASETSTGALHPIEELGRLTRERETLLVVDGISAVGVSPCPMDAWHIDCLLTGSQKGLMLPPGLAFVCLSQKAWDKADKIPNKPFYFNLPAERDNAMAGQTLFTPAVSLLVGLDVTLRLFMGDDPKAGLDALYAKQWALTALTRTGLEAMGLELLARDLYTWGLTSVLLPSGVDGQKLLQRAAEDHGVIMAGGQGRLKGRIVRIGHMGHVDWGDLCAGLHAFAKAYIACGGHIGCRDYMEQGMAAYEQALNLWPETL
jgi:aspartate aminotransferase-like enzyme